MKNKAFIETNSTYSRYYYNNYKDVKDLFIMTMLNGGLTYFFEFLSDKQIKVYNHLFKTSIVNISDLNENSFKEILESNVVEYSYRKVEIEDFI